MKYIPLKKLAEELGLSYITVWRWHKEGKIRTVKLPNGKLAVPYDEYFRLTGQLYKQTATKENRAVIYARVSSRNQQKNGDLDRQVEALKKYAKDHGYKVVDIITDVGSGLNPNRRGLRKLFEYVVKGMTDYVIVAHKDRLTRFGYEYLEYFFNQFGVQIVVAFGDKYKTPLEELVEDFIAIVTSFSARLYGRRSRYAKKLVEIVKEYIEKTHNLLA